MVLVLLVVPLLVAPSRCLTALPSPTSTTRFQPRPRASSSSPRLPPRLTTPCSLIMLRGDEIYGGVIRQEFKSSGEGHEKREANKAHAWERVL
ncbi:hypothetical protein QVD17_06203 [Tagetes erecta]|uniref:Secreted protein n=1 Tax=Tagetes erecta TaxID=13708 RepID=A0AAD8LIY1_TARER|nr:hypothetical protein QVD17_06203 [Tagetes erecta]